MSQNMKAFLEHCKRRLERNMHDIKNNSALIVKLCNAPVTKELIEETGMYKLIRNLCKRDDEMGETSLMVFRKWRKFYGDGVLTPTKESITQLSSKMPPSSIESHRNLTDPLSKCQNVPFQKESKHQSNSRPDPKHQLSGPLNPEPKHSQLSSFRDSKHPFANLLAESKHQTLPSSKSESKHPPSKSEPKHPQIPSSKHLLSSPSKPEAKRISPSKPGSKHPFSSPSKLDARHRSGVPTSDKRPLPMPKLDTKHQPSSHPKPEPRHFASKVEPPRFHSSSSVALESKQQHPRPDPKQRLAHSVSKPESDALESKQQHSRPDPKHRLAHSVSQAESKHQHISPPNPELRHQLSSPKLDYKPPSFAGKIRESNPSLSVLPWLDKFPDSKRDFGSAAKPPKHSVDNHHSSSHQKSQLSHAENHSSSFQERRHKPSVSSHPAFASGGHTTLSHQRTSEKPNVHHNSFDSSMYCAKDEKPANHFDSSLECGLDVLDTLPGHQRNNDALIGQESRSSFGSENPEASLDITNGEKCDGHLDEDSNALGSSPTKRVFVEPYAIAMREGMFRVVKSKERIPANILRLQQVYDREIMAGRPKRSSNPKGSEEKNSKKPSDQTKPSDEGPSTPSKTKKSSSGAKGTPPKPKPSSSTLRSTESRPEAGQSSSNNKVKASEEERIRASKETRKWLKMGESDDPFHTQKMRKTYHHQ